MSDVRAEFIFRPEFNEYKQNKGFVTNRLVIWNIFVQRFIQLFLKISLQTLKMLT
jgi:hypothetical protein